MDGNRVVGTNRIRDVLTISRKRSDSVLVQDAGSKGWMKLQHLIPFEKAYDYFSATLKQHPQDADALLGRANLALWSGQAIGSMSGTDKERVDFLLQEALADFGQSALAQPGVDAFVGSGLVRSMAGIFQQTVAAFGRAIQLDPNNMEAIRHRALLLIDMDEVDRAIADCDRILDRQATMQRY